MTAIDVHREHRYEISTISLAEARLSTSPSHSPAPIVGAAVTVKTRVGDNLAILPAYDFCRPGDVTVVDAGGDISNTPAGGIMTLGAASLGLAGMVLDGAICDVAEFRQRTFPVYARSVTHRGPYKDGPGAINVPITIGGMPVNAGDIIVGDQDRLLAFPPSLAERPSRRHWRRSKKSKAPSTRPRRPMGSRLRRCPRGALRELYGAAAFQFEQLTLAVANQLSSHHQSPN